MDHLTIKNEQNISSTEPENKKKSSLRDTNSSVIDINEEPGKLVPMEENFSDNKDDRVTTIYDLSVDSNEPIISTIASNGTVIGLNTFSNTSSTSSVKYVGTITNDDSNQYSQDGKYLRNVIDLSKNSNDPVVIEERVHVGEKGKKIDFSGLGVHEGKVVEGLTESRNVLRDVLGFDGFKEVEVREKKRLSPPPIPMNYKDMLQRGRESKNRRVGKKSMKILSNVLKQESFLVKQKGSGHLGNSVKIKSPSEAIVRNIQSRFNRNDELRSYRGFCDKKELCFVNTRQKPIAFCYRGLGKEEYKELFLEVGKLVKIDPTSEYICEERITGLPLVGAIYILRLDPREKFKDPVTNSMVYQFAIHKQVRSFDLPPLKNEKLRWFFVMDPGNGEKCQVGYDRYTFNDKKVTYLEIHICSKIKKVGEGRRYITYGDYAVIHFHGPSKESITVEMVKYYYPKKAVRTNPKRVTQAVIRNRLKQSNTVPEAIFDVKNKKSARGRVDMNLKKSIIYQRQSKIRKDDPEQNGDIVAKILNERDNPKDLIKWVHGITFDHSKGGMMIVCFLPALWIMFRCLKRCFDDQLLVSFLDMTYRMCRKRKVSNKSDPKNAEYFVTYLHLRFTCCKRPINIPGGYVIHRWADKESYEYLGNVMKKFISSDCYPDVYIKDDEIALMGLLQILFSEMIVRGRVATAILCVWHIVENFGWELPSSMNNKEREYLKYELSKVCYSNSVCEYDAKSQLFVKLLEKKNLLREKDYFLKNKYLKIRNNVVTAKSLFSEDLIVVNSPIEGKNGALKKTVNGIDGSNIYSLVMKLKKDNLANFRILMEAVFSLNEESQYNIKDGVLDFMEGIKNDIVAAWFDKDSGLDQTKFLLSCAEKFPGLLASFGIQEPETLTKFEFMSDTRKYKIRRLPFNLRQIFEDLKLDIVDFEGTRDVILKYMNNNASTKLLTQNELCFYSSSYKCFKKCSITGNVPLCEVCGNCLCPHLIYHCFLTNRLSRLQLLIGNIKIRDTSKWGRSGLKKSDKIKPGKIADKFQIIVREFPLIAQASNVGLKFISPLHGFTKVTISRDNLKIYKNQDLKNVCRTNSFKGFSKCAKYDDLLSFTVDNLVLLAKEKCMFCEGGELGFVCTSSECELKAYVHNHKNSELDDRSLENVKLYISTNFGVDYFIQLKNEEKEKISMLLKKDGSVLDITDMNNLILNHQRESDYFMMNILLDINNYYELDVPIPSDGNCLFTVAIHQLYQSLEKKESQKLRKVLCDYGEKNEARYSQFAEGNWSEWIESMREDGTFGENIVLRLIVDFFQVRVLVLSTGLEGFHEILPDGVGFIQTINFGFLNKLKHYISIMKCTQELVQYPKGIDELVLQQNLVQEDDEDLLPLRTLLPSSTQTLPTIETIPISASITGNKTNPSQFGLDLSQESPHNKKLKVAETLDYLPPVNRVSANRKKSLRSLFILKKLMCEKCGISITFKNYFCCDNCKRVFHLECKKCGEKKRGFRSLFLCCDCL